MPFIRCHTLTALTKTLVLSTPSTSTKFQKLWLDNETELLDMDSDLFILNVSLTEET